MQYTTATAPASDGVNIPMRRPAIIPNGNSSARTRKIASWFYTYGVRTCAGVYETGSDPLLIERITVSRDTTLDEFKRELEIP